MSTPAPDTTPAAPAPVVEAPAAAPSRGATLDQWKSAKRHYITLQSGTVVGVEFPDLPNLIRLGQIPNALINVAIGVANGKKVTAEDIVEQATFYNQLVAMTVKEPAISEEDVAGGLIPTEDKELIVELAVRQRDFDAVGHHIGGLETNAEFRNFRGLLPLDAYGGNL